MNLLNNYVSVCTYNGIVVSVKMCVLVCEPRVRVQFIHSLRCVFSVFQITNITSSPSIIHFTPDFCPQTLYTEFLKYQFPQVSLCLKLYYLYYH